MTDRSKWDTPIGHCQVCSHALPWETSTMPGHRADGSTTPHPRKQEQCTGSHKPPVEAVRAPGRKPTAAERKLARELFG